ncbi:MAG: hypothetical protein K8823_342 [Cenarchaeum symbiont of Oopsacas minuta]|nr:hypothetical protein [Cenarchaeum symbiont of Oopsacas minuta]
MDRHYPLELYECKSKGNSVSVGALYCTKCNRFYPIVDGIPVMLPDELRDKKLDSDFLKDNADTIPEKIKTAKGAFDIS